LFWAPFWKEKEKGKLRKKSPSWKINKGKEKEGKILVSQNNPQIGRKLGTHMALFGDGAPEKTFTQKKGKPLP